MRRLLSLVFVFACAACVRRAEEPPAPESAPVVAVAQPPAPEPVPVVAPEPAPIVAPRPALPVAPEPLPVAPGRTNGIGNRVVIDGLAVWVEAVEYKRTKVVSRETGEVVDFPERKQLVVTFGLQSTDPAKTFEYNTWAGRGAPAPKDALGRMWSHNLYSHKAIDFGRVEVATVTFEKPVFDALNFHGGSAGTPGGGLDFAGACYLDIDLPQPPKPFDESRVYRFRVRVSEFK